MATFDQAVAQMVANGMPAFPGSGFPRINTDRIIRYGPKGRAWYRLFEQQSRGGQVFVSGAYGIWGQLDKTLVETDWSGIDEADRARMQRERKEAERREQAKRDERAVMAARRAKEQYLGAKHQGMASPYLEKKGVEPERGLRFLDDGTLLVPMLLYDHEPKPELKGLQKIAPDGSKRFNGGMAKEGTACLLGVTPKKGEAILVCEGVATGLSIRAGVGRSRPVFVAFDAYNLVPVAKLLRKVYPGSAIVICADDDYLTPGNPGMSKAQQAADLAGNAIVIAPKFAKRVDERWTDYNDLHKQEGMAALEKCLADGLAGIDTAPAPAKKRKKDTPVDWDAIAVMLDRFTLIYPSVTAYDHSIEQIVNLSHMRANFGDVLVDIWQASPKRRTVNSADVVFDPTCKCDPKTTINLFRGLPLEPNATAACTKTLRLLYHLCGEDDLIFDWVLKWTAYPLQHRGAKMRTAIVMHGGEGAGKNIFWGAVRDIYGDHGGVITQMQLQNQFNEWLSAKLFLVANEVVTRQDIRHLVGYIKNLITEPEVYINPKGLPARREANYMNAVFLSNELQPLQLRWDDRRNQVIRTPGELDPQFYIEVGEELRAGGVEALYYFLLHYDLGTFSEHTKPLMTDAKRDLIELGKSSTELFWTELHEDLVPLPYIPCFQHDLYRAYLRWCAQHGEKMPSKSARFSAEFMSMNGVRKRVKRIPDPDRSDEVLLNRKAIPQRTMFIMGEAPAETDEFDWLTKNAATFRGRLRDYLNPGRDEEQF